MTPAVDSKTLSLGVVILAAGASTRMGRPKMLLPWGTTSILGHLIHQWSSLLATQIAVVCAAGDNAIREELGRLEFPDENRILNPSPERGMFSSIQCAARWDGWRPGLTHWTIVLGDQPHLRPDTLRALLDFGAAHQGKICQPSRQGKPRHPVLLPGAAFGRLKDAPEDVLKKFLQNNLDDLACCEIDDPGLDADLDRPEDYERALQHFFPEAK